MIQPTTLPSSLSIPAIKWERVALIAVLTIAAVTHAINMLGFPFYNNDEGTNIASAWAMLETGDLSPYTYDYKNPPMGALIMASWTAITSIIPSATELNSGRVLMLIVHLFTIVMIYGISRKLGLRAPITLLAILIFSLSPLVITMQRRILLENMMALSVLIAFFAILGKDRNLGHYAISALAIGIAFLIDITAIFFAPALYYIVLKHSHPWHKRFAVALWVGLALSLFLEFPLHAQLKDELFPTGVLFGGGHPHLSLIEAHASLVDRVELNEFLQSDSSFMRNLDAWGNPNRIGADFAFAIVGFSCLILAMLRSIWDKPLMLFSALVLPYFIHLITIDKVFDSDIIVLLPMMAISIAIVLQTVLDYIEKHYRRKLFRYSLYGAVVTPLVLFAGWSTIKNTEVYTLNQVEGQMEAANWLSHQAFFEAVIVTDNYAFVELRHSIPRTHYYWTVDTDPEVRNDVVENNWCNIDYMLTTPQTVEDMRQNRLRLIETAYLNSTILRTFENNGWPIEVREVNQRNCNIPFPQR